LFPSRKGDQPITPTQAYRQLNKAARMVDIESGIGTHTMRKTFGYWFYKQTKNVAKLQNLLNHSHPDITEEEIEGIYNNKHFPDPTPYWLYLYRFLYGYLNGSPHYINR
jgi:integrase